MTEPITKVDPLNESSNGVTSAQSSEKIRSLRAAIDAKLHEQGIYDQIRDLVHLKSKVTTSVDGENHQPNSEGDAAGDEEAARSREDQLIHDVLESEVVQQLLATVRSMELAPPARDGDKSSTRLETEGGIDDDNTDNERGVFLYLRLCGGKAFVDQLVDLDGNLGDEVDTGLDETKCPVGSVLVFFRVNVTFQQQRQCSRDIRCCVDPPFDEHFRFRVEKKRTRSARTRGGSTYAVDVTSPWEALCLVEEPVQLDLVKVTKKLLSRDNESIARWSEVSSELLAVHRLDWRRVLCSTLQLVHFPVQLAGRMKEPVGSLDIRADLLNCKRTGNIAREARAFLNKEALHRNTSNHAFYKYAKQWWEEYRSETREVKLQSPKRPNNTESPDGREDEYSQLLAQIGSRQRLVKMFAEDEEGRYRMVCKFIVPLRIATAVRSPSEAARFVGLLPYESNALVGGAMDETWRSLATVLSLRKGDSQDHAVRVVLGLPTCTSVTGEKFAVHDTRASTRRGYCAIDCVFNHRQFFANLQPRAWKLAESSFDFDDESCWKRMDENLIADLPFGQPPTSLTAPDLASVPVLEQEWAATLKRAISSRRRAEGLVTRWSDELGFYLLPALNSYELERLYGVSQVDNAFFQQSVTNFVQEGHTFQGVPSMFTVELADDALAAMTSNPLVADILTLHARSAQFALAVRCFPYAQHTFATWVMLAVSYQSKS
ncbi:unnamed protein product [Phytophthora fragariaefolia]|uniref:Unnamed protein product n=1 Tax=Phytophthora fragariaefolia TaxID=1490495 RepID=A0A9W6TPG8_9STRA|nr:unnamed protein product [Phytophthora fragariaefolia]